MEKHVLSKSTFIRGVQCLKSLYLHKKRPFLRDKLSVEQRAKFSRGSDIGQLARNLFPDGINLQPKSPSQYRKSVLQTREAIERESNDIIYEAAFQADGVLILLDILQKKNGKWYAFEVKSSAKISDTYIMDAALQYYVITQSGIELEDIFIIHINPDYVFEDKLEIEKLFVSRSVLSEAKKQQAYIREQIVRSKEVLQLKHSPPINISKQCFQPYSCDFLGHCWKHLPKKSIFDLPHLSMEEKFSYYEKGIMGIDQLTEALNEPNVYSHILKSHLDGKEYIDQEYLEAFLPEITENTAFIQILFNKIALPSIKGAMPYQHVPVAVAFSIGENTEKPLIRVFKKRQDAFAELNSFIQDHLKNIKNLVSYDMPAFQAYLDTHRLPRIQKMIGLQELLLQLRYYHPGLKNDYSLHNVGKILLKDKAFSYQSDTALFADIQTKTSKEDKLIGEDESSKVEVYVKRQLYTIQGLYRYLRSR